MKKGQAAMEFLMTYGWAILVVIAAIAALAYFGVLDPARLLPERCQFPAGMDCIDKAAITTTGITFALKNNNGFPVTVSSATTTACQGTATFAVGASNTTFTSSAVVPNNEVLKVNIACSLNKGNKFDANDVTVTYTNTESGLTNNAVGSIRGKVA
ncbi:MAG: hypothetical protein QW757_05885 [Candidatus Woesearchaeota archaeon]